MQLDATAQQRSSVRTRRFTLALGLGLVLVMGAWPAEQASAKKSQTKVPLARLIESARRAIQLTPSDAHAHFVLGRLHGLAYLNSFNKSNDPDWVTLELASTSTFPSIADPHHCLADAQIDARGEHHLIEALIEFKTGHSLASSDPRSLLGMGWCLEEVARWPGLLPAPRSLHHKPDTKGWDKAWSKHWRNIARLTFLRAFNAAVEADLMLPNDNQQDVRLVLDAGQAILRLSKALGKTKRDYPEIERITQTMGFLRNQPRYLTPIIFSLDGSATLEALLAEKKTALFDLDDDGTASRWPWVRPTTGFLVWDPDGKGKIESGRQLFGTVTWGFFWEHGYQPLGRLDGNQDGWLTGKELAGLAVWVDANGDGASDPGEVTPLKALGVKKIGAKAVRSKSGIYHNPKGIEFRTGEVVPTFDWSPKSLPAKDKK